MVRVRVFTVHEFTSWLISDFHSCIKINEFSDIIPNLNEYKIYAPGFGFIKEVTVTDKEEVVLIAVQ